jgi:hypothetical protein
LVTSHQKCKLQIVYIRRVLEARFDRNVLIPVPLEPFHSAPLPTFNRVSIQALLSKPLLSYNLHLTPLFFGHLEATPSYNNAIKRYLHRYRSPRFRLSGDVGRSHRLHRGGLHWHSGREFHIVASHMFHFGRRLDEVTQLFWCPQWNPVLRFWWCPRFLRRWLAVDFWWWLWMWNRACRVSCLSELF